MRALEPFFLEHTATGAGASEFGAFLGARDGAVADDGLFDVGVLVHDVFNASLAAKDLPRDFVHNPAEDVWESAEDGGAHRVAVGTESAPL